MRGSQPTIPRLLFQVEISVVRNDPSRGQNNNSNHAAYPSFRIPESMSAANVGGVAVGGIPSSMVAEEGRGAAMGGVPGADRAGKGDQRML